MELPQEVSFDIVYAESVGLPMVSRFVYSRKSVDSRLPVCLEKYDICFAEYNSIMTSARNDQKKRNKIYRNNK